jgi:hypothetical protein
MLLLLPPAAAKVKGDFSGTPRTPAEDEVLCTPMLFGDMLSRLYISIVWHNRVKVGVFNVGMKGVNVCIYLSTLACQDPLHSV